MICIHLIFVNNLKLLSLYIEKKGCIENQGVNVIQQNAGYTWLFAYYSSIILLELKSINFVLSYPLHNFLGHVFVPYLMFSFFFCFLFWEGGLYQPFPYFTYIIGHQTSVFICPQVYIRFLHGGPVKLLLDVCIWNLIYGTNFHKNTNVILQLNFSISNTDISNTMDMSN